MGGFGSGRRSFNKCTDEMHELDVRKLQRQRLLIPGNAIVWTWLRSGRTTAEINLRMGVDCVTLEYQRRQRGGSWEPVSAPVRLVWTACTFGGRRAWWRCPAAGCGRRVAVLFGGSTFACRHCHGLAYRSQRETAIDLTARRANTLRRRLGWQPGILNGDGFKPKGMHWKTFERLTALQKAHANAVLAGLVARLGDSRGSPGEPAGDVARSCRR